MKLLAWLLTPAKSGIEHAVSKAIELAILGLGGLILTFLLARIPGFTDTFWASKRFALYELIIWLLATAAAAALITFSLMQRKLKRLEAEAESKLKRIEAEAEKRAQELKEVSELDPATGLLNLRAYKEQLPKAMETARLANEPLTMVIFDIDGFKEINTLVGHDRANVILKAVAACLNPRAPDQAFRYPENVDRKTQSVTFRYGGDEFIILAFNTAMFGGTNEATRKRVNNGFIMAERLQTNVCAINVHALVYEPGESNTPSKVTVSAGIADSNPAQEPEDTIAALTRRAERALIAAKRLNAKATRAAETFKGTIVPYKLDLEHSQGQAPGST
jgi:diguanylate cyclase (GGDEF)-like protein